MIVTSVSFSRKLIIEAEVCGFEYTTVRSVVTALILVSDGRCNWLLIVTDFVENIVGSVKHHKHYMPEIQIKSLNQRAKHTQNFSWKNYRFCRITDYANILYAKLYNSSRFYTIRSIKSCGIHKISLNNYGIS